MYTYIIWLIFCVGPIIGTYLVQSKRKKVAEKQLIHLLTLRRLNF